MTLKPRKNFTQGYMTIFHNMLCKDWKIYMQKLKNSPKFQLTVGDEEYTFDLVTFLLSLREVSLVNQIILLIEWLVIYKDLFIHVLGKTIPDVSLLWFLLYHDNIISLNYLPSIRDVTKNIKLFQCKLDVIGFPNIPEVLRFNCRV